MKQTLPGTQNLFVAFMIFAIGWGSMTLAVAGDPGAVSAAMAADGRSYTVTVPGMGVFRSGFSARAMIGDVNQDLPSSGGTVITNAVHSTEATPYGPADIIETTIRFEKEHVDLMLRLGRVQGMPAVLAQAGMRNGGTQPVSLRVLKPVELAGKLDGSPADWLVTPLGECEQDVVALSNVTGSHFVWEYGGLYRKDGRGFLFGPVGTPVAYINALLKHSGGGKVSLTLSAQMSGTRVDAGETRWGQQVVLLMEPPRAALSRWAEWVAGTHGARTSKGALTGWSSWYFLYDKVTGKTILDVADSALKSSGRLRPGVIQIDQGYEASEDGKETNEKFPEGLAFYAQRIAATGARPGLLLGVPLQPLGLPSVFDRNTFASLAGRISHAVKCGFSYVKLDFYGSTPGIDFDPKMTSFEAMRDGFTKLREAAGNETYLLYCGLDPNRATVGLVDSSRTSSAADRNSVADVMRRVMRSYQLNGRWFAIDNCNYYIGTDVENISGIAGGWPLVRTWMSMAGLSCGAAITSDPWYWESFRPYWRNVEVMTPPAKERTEVLDLCTSEDLSRLVGHVRRDWGDSTVALLWNPGDKERSVTLNFAQAGMDPQRRYAVWSFWDYRYLGVTKGSWTTPALESSASQHLCFTDLDRSPDWPVLIGSSLHIYCGAAEIKHVTSSRRAMAIELTDAGARDGDLFIYSRLPMILKKATGCAVTGVAQAGEYVWRISLVDRKRDVQQRVELGILLPVTQQIWFWLLIATVAMSLLIAFWRYVAWQRIRRVNELEQERARIARDIHDDLGTSLTRISVMADGGAGAGQDPAAMQSHLASIRTVANDMTRAMDEIVWAMNPRNDTLESMMHYLGDYAEGFVGPAGLRLRLDVPLQLPEWLMPAEARHNLFLAFKEALNNVVRHASAHEVRVILRVEQRRFRLVVQDDGCGLPVEQAQAPGGNGLINMRNRMAKVGGECRVTGAPGQGTTVEFVVPASPAGRKG